MEFLGTVDIAGDAGTTIATCSKDIPDIGTQVFDSNKKQIGTVKRVFGPVDGPFVTVAVDDAAVLSNLKGKDLYIMRRTQNGKDKRRNRRD